MCDENTKPKWSQCPAPTPAQAGATYSAASLPPTDLGARRAFERRYLLNLLDHYAKAQADRREPQEP